MVYHFNSSLAALQAAFPDAVTMDRNAGCLKDWNAGEIKMLLIHPKSAGYGLNMQHGGHRVVFYDLPWSYTDYFQTIGRLARQGQKRVVIVQSLIARGTVDETVLKTLKEKGERQEFMANLLKRLRSGRNDCFAIKN